MVSTERWRRALTATLEGVAPADLPRLSSFEFYRGKVRDNFTSPTGASPAIRVLCTTDRLSAFDKVITTLPFKGQVLNRLASYWFDQTRELAPNHLLRTPDPNVVIARACTPLPVEMVVRSYLTGVTSTSVYTHYARGERVFCGHSLPDGLKKNDRLPRPILTPSSKAEKGGHDQSMSREEVLASTGMSAAHFDRAAELSLQLFQFGVELAAKRGLILADTKYEFGLDGAGEVTLIDEIHTPDSSRYWQASSYSERLERGEEPESFDKEFVRRWLAGIGFVGEGPIPVVPDEVRIEAAQRYAQAFQAITGIEFVPEESEPVSRIRKNLESSPELP